MRNAKPLEMPEPRRAARLRLAPPRPLVLLVVALAEAPDLQSPRLYRIAGEAELAVRNADLRCPSVGIDVRRGLPHRIPRRVTTRRADADVIALRSRRIQIEEGAAEVIVVPIDHELEVVRIEVVVATHQARRHALCARAVVHLRAHVECVVVKKKTHLGTLRAGLALVRIDLSEFGDRRRRLPRILVKFRVEDDRPGSPCGHRRRHWYRVASWRLGSKGGDRDGHQCEQQGGGRSHSLRWSRKGRLLGSRIRHGNGRESSIRADPVVYVTTPANDSPRWVSRPATPLPDRERLLGARAGRWQRPRPSPPARLPSPTRPRPRYSR